MCLHIPGKTKTTSKQHILKSIITVRSIEPVVSNLRRHFFQCSSFPILGRKFFYQSSVRKIFTFPQVFDKKLSHIFKLNVAYLIDEVTI